MPRTRPGAGRGANSPVIVEDTRPRRATANWHRALDAQGVDVMHARPRLASWPDSFDHDLDRTGASAAQVVIYRERHPDQCSSWMAGLGRRDARHTNGQGGDRGAEGLAGVPNVNPTRASRRSTCSRAKRACTTPRVRGVAASVSAILGFINRPLTSRRTRGSTGCLTNNPSEKAWLEGDTACHRHAASKDVINVVGRGKRRYWHWIIRRAKDCRRPPTREHYGATRGAA